MRLSTGVELGLTPGAVEGLAGASAEDLRAVEVEAQGLGLHFPRLDADLYVPALLDGLLGSRRWLASRLGTVGGQARSETKAMASRENGRKGGRPKVSGYPGYPNQGRLNCGVASEGLRREEAGFHEGNRCFSNPEGSPRMD